MGNYQSMYYTYIVKGFRLVGQMIFPLANQKSRDSHLKVEILLLISCSFYGSHSFEICVTSCYVLLTVNKFVFRMSTLVHFPQKEALVR